MRHLRALALGIVALSLASGVGCMVMRKTYDADLAAERQKTVTTQKDLAQARATLVALEEQSRRKDDVIAKKDADLAQAQKALVAATGRAESLEAQVRIAEADAAKARGEAADEKARAATGQKDVEALRAQLKAAQDKITDLAQQLEAAKKPAP